VSDRPRARRSQRAQIALPQQVGVELGIRNASGAVYENALPEPQKAQVRMGRHAYDGSFSTISVVPFPEVSQLRAGIEAPCPQFTSESQRLVVLPTAPQ
jgi:hypothetical protein